MKTSHKNKKEVLECLVEIESIVDLIPFDEKHKIIKLIETVIRYVNNQDD